MIPAPLYLVATRHTPAPAPGLTLATAGGWLLGRLVVDEPEASSAVHEAWARSIALHAYADEEPAVLSRPLAGPRPLLQDPLPGRSAGGPLDLPFALDLRDLLGDEAGRGWFVRATAREHASAAVHVRPGQGPLDLAAPRSPGEALVLARDQLRAGRAAEADALFGAALADEARKADLLSGALHDAACAAARVGAADPASRHAAGGRALALLRDDLQRRRAALAARLHRHVGATLEGADDPAWDALVEESVAHLRWTRDEEPDLASLRSSMAFAGLFRVEPRRGVSGRL